jgi:integrase
MRDWEKAQQRIRDWEAEGRSLEEPEEISIGDACNAFERDAGARGLRPGSLKKYQVLFKQLKNFAAQLGLLWIKQLDLPTLRRFRESWADGGISALKKIERLRAFLRFNHENRWIPENPAKGLKGPRVTNPPTMPFSQEEMVRIIAACDQYPDNYGNTGQDNARRVRALILLLRYSGLRIGDGATCARDRLKGDRLFLYTQKTGVPVNVKLPPVAVEALESVQSVSREYYFWTGLGDKDTVAGNWRRSLRRLFRLAGIPDAHPHRFRDTFAVELLLAGVPIERVSILLGHSSIRVTERHYSPWIHARQAQLEADLERSWARDPVVLAFAKGTPDVQVKVDPVN